MAIRRGINKYTNLNGGAEIDQGVANVYTPLPGELVVDLDNYSLWVGDGVTPGGLNLSSGFFTGNAAGSNTQIQYNNNGNLAGDPGFRFDQRISTLYVPTISATTIALAGSFNLTGNLNASNVNASYFLGNGAFLTGLPSQYSNANVANYLPTYTGNIQAANIAASYFLGNGRFLTGLPAQYSNADVANYLPTYTGVISAGDVIANAVMSNVITDRNGNPYVGLNYSNSNVQSYLTGLVGNIIPSGNGVYSLGNATNQWRSLYVSNNTIYINNVPLTIVGSNTLQVAGSNVIVNNSSNNIVTTGNVAANYFLGNASVTNLIVGGVANLGPISNVKIGGASANQVGYYLQTDGTGNVFWAAGATPTGNGTAAGTTGAIQISLDGSGNFGFVAGFQYNFNLNQIEFPVPLVSHSNITADNVIANYFLGDGGRLSNINANYSNANVDSYLPVYQGNIGSFTNANATFRGNIITANIFPAQYANGSYPTLGTPSNPWGTIYSTAGVVVGGPTGAALQSLLAGTASFTDPASGLPADLRAGDGLFNGSLTVTQGISAIGTIAGNNISATNNILGLDANISNNVVANTIIANNFQTPGNFAGNNAVLSNNVIAGRLISDVLLYANGNPYSFVTYSNSNVASYLPTYTGNIQAANISANYYLGNGALLTGITSYSNALVANYLLAYTGNLSAGNLEITTDATFGRDVSVIGNLRVQGNTTFVNTSTLNVANLAIVLAANAAVPSDANGAGIIINGANLTLLYNSVSDSFVLNKNFTAPSVTATGNITANYFLGNGSFLTNVLTTNNLYTNANVQTYLPTYTGNIQAGNLTVNANIQTGNLQTTRLLSISANISGNASVGNLATDGLYHVNGSPWVAADFVGYYTNANVANYFLVNTGNIRAGNLNVIGNAAFAVDVTVANSFTGYLVNGTYVLTDNLLHANSTPWNINDFPGAYSNTNASSYLQTYGGNILAGNVIYTDNTVQTTAFLGYDNATFFGNISAVGGLFTTISGQLITPSQPYITDVGILTSLTVGGNISAGNISAVRFRGAVTGNVTGNVAGNVTGNLIGNSYGTHFGNVTGNIAGNVTGNLIGNSTGLHTGNVVGTILTADQPNITSVGTLGNLTVAGNTVTANIFANYFYPNGSPLVLVGNYSNSNVANYLPIYGGNILGNTIIANTIIANGNLQFNKQTVAYTSPGPVVSTGSYSWSWQLVSSNNQIANVTTISHIDTAQGVTAGTVTSVVNDFGNSWTLNFTTPYNNISNVGNAQLLYGQTNINFSDDTIQTTAFLGYKDAVFGGNVSANYFLGNGAFLTDINASNLIGGYSNANVANYLPIFTGNISAGNANITGNVSANYFLGNITQATGYYVYGNSNVISLLSSNSNLTVTVGVANITTQGNITGNYIFGNIQFANGFNAYGNSNVDNYLASNSNITVTVGIANITTQGNVSANYFLGNGYFLTGLAATYSNSDVANYLASNSNVIVTVGTGNITTQGNITGNYIFGNIQFANGFNAYGNANVANYLPVYGGNVLANTITGNGNLNLVSSNGYNIVANAGNGAIGLFSGNSQIFVNNDFPGAGIIAPTIALTPTNGGDIIFDLNVGNSDFFIDTLTGSWQFNNDGNLYGLGANANISGNVQANYFLGNGAFITGLPAGYANSNVADYLASNSNITITTGTANITTQGNIEGNYILGNGAFLTGLPSQYSNANVANYLPTYTGNLISLTGDVTTTANVSANYFLGNIEFATGGYSNANVANYLPTYTGNLNPGNITVNDNVVVLGNLRVEGNTTIINSNTIITGDKNIVLANGAQQPSDANGAGINIGSNGQYATLTWNSTANLWVASQDLAANGNLFANFIESTGNISALANIIAQGNVTGNYLLGNITQATGYYIYGNSNVANYLPTYSGNLDSLAGNVVTTGNISANYYVGNGSQLIGIYRTVLTRASGNVQILN